MRLTLISSIICIIFYAGLASAKEPQKPCPIPFSEAATRFLFCPPADFRTIPEAEVLHEKSMGIAIALSLVLPGAGELYSGRIVQGLIFLGVEAAGWTTYIHYNSKGDDIDAEFRRYADTQWDENGYLTWLEEYKETHGGNVPDDFTHHLPDTKTQQYYEMIGKYDQFVRWWDDYDPNVGQYGQSQKRLYYEERRHQSNVNYDRAKLAGVVIFLNRIVSLIDTIYGVKTQNSYSKKGWSLRFNQKRFNGYPSQFLSVRYKWK